jgi:hypothetical protein
MTFDPNPSPGLSPHASTDHDLDRLIAAIRSNIDLQALSLPEEYFYASLPLCVIDAVFSIGVTYTSTQATVRRWCERQAPPWPRLRDRGGPEATISEFLQVLRASTPENLAVTMFGNSQRTSSRSGILKADAVLRFAEVLQRHGVEGFGDTEDVARNADIAREIAAIPGQGSGISWDYFLMLAGSDRFVKADRMICRFVGDGLGGAPASAGVARSLLVRAADALADQDPRVTPRALDYAVWNYQRAAN